MAIHLYKTSTPSTCNGAVDSQVKSNPRNNLIYGQHRCGKGRNATSPNMYVIENIIEDTKTLMTTLTGVSYTHVCRQANGIVARTALLSGNSCKWDEVPPDLITDLLVKENGM